MCGMFVAVALFHGLLNSHGFGGNTYVRTSTEYIESIQQIVEQNSAQSVLSYHLNTQECHLHQILARAQSTTNCYFAINLDDYPAVDIACSPLQQFYLPEKNSWIPAHELQVGDILLTAREGSKPIVRITFVQQKLELYTLKIACPHTFFVGRYSVLTHNMNLPVSSLC